MFARRYCLSIAFNRKRNVVTFRYDHALVRSHRRRRGRQGASALRVRIVDRCPGMQCNSIAALRDG